MAVDTEPTEEQRLEAQGAGETWVFYPNDLPKRSAYSGDTRWALAPFLAHKVLFLVGSTQLYPSYCGTPFIHHASDAAGNICE